MFDVLLVLAGIVMVFALLAVYALRKSEETNDIINEIGKRKKEIDEHADI